MKWIRAHGSRLPTLCAALVALGTAPAAADEAAARVHSVVVYPDRAQVTRSREVACGDRVAVAFTGLPPAADAASLRAAVSAGRVDGLRSEDKPQTAAFSREAEELDEQLRRVNQDLRAEAEARSRADGANRLAEGYAGVATRLISREMVEGPDIAAWRAALDAVLNARLQSGAETVESNARTRGLERRLAELRERRAHLDAAAGRRALAAEVLVTCPAGQRARVALSYLVGGASWAAAHEARLADDGRSVALASYATISQSTGEDWRDAQIIVSTAIPRQSATPPEVAPLRVYAGQREPPRRVLTTREEATRTTSNTASPDKPAQSAARVADQGLSVQFVAPRPGDVRGDGTPTRVLLAQRALPAQVAFRAVPKLLPYVFRIADVDNNGDVPLLPGPLSAFRRGQFMATYPIERIAAGERFPLSFGLVENLKVHRQVLEELEVDRGLLGKARRHRFAYKLEVANYLGSAAQIEISEHIPVSELDDVKVLVDPRTTPGYKLRPEDGIVTWTVSLQNGERRPYELRYAVDVPAAYVGGQ